MPNYGEPTYWDHRYKTQKGKTFDWLEDYSSLRPVLGNLVGRDHSILHLGCGNAELSEEMYDDGYRNSVNIDISNICIAEMKERSKHRVGMQWLEMDAMDMSFEDETFDIVIDKSTLDAILCGNDSFLNAAKMIMEVQRVLKTGGLYVVISYGSPQNRYFHFVRPHLSFQYNCFILYSKKPQGEKLHEFETVLNS